MSPKKILVLKGSPREKGNSSILADQVVAGAKAAGAEVESFVLQNMHIEPCTACEACHEEPGNLCNIEDDMQMLYPKLIAADAIVVATPIYWFAVSAQAKLCIDRWYALETPQGSKLTGKQFAFVLVYGDSDLFTSGGINAIHSFQDMCRYLKAPIAGFAYGSANEAGDILKQSDLLEKARKLGQKLAGVS